MVPHNMLLWHKDFELKVIGKIFRKSSLPSFLICLKKAGYITLCKGMPSPSPHTRKKVALTI